MAPTLTIAMHRDMQLSSPITATELLAERFLSRVAGAGLDHMLPTLVADGSYTMVQLRDLFARLSYSAPMAELRDRFIRHPSGNGLRTPNRRTAVKPLRELVDTGLEAL
ncbi:hypothetical protein [Amycolatopsis sp. NPDC004625]|uniref:hypothetical protein n=1 Tax=Amycolatopsis sp. NPDC004625 TaxID=3154670 RepID=UPI0033A8663C